MASGLSLLSGPDFLVSHKVLETELCEKPDRFHSPSSACFTGRWRQESRFGVERAEELSSSPKPATCQLCDPGQVI